MAKKDMYRESVIDILVIFAIMYFWYYILEVVFEFMEGSSRAGLSIILAILTFKFIGRSVMKYLKW